MKLLREITMTKFDQVSSHILEYIEDYEYYTEEEKIKYEQQSYGKKVEGDTKPEFTIMEKTKDLKMAIYGNVAGKATLYKPIDFSLLGFSSKLPRQHLTQKVVMRGIWTSYNYVIPEKYCPDITVGGVLDLKLFKYPE